MEFLPASPGAREIAQRSFLGFCFSARSGWLLPAGSRGQHRGGHDTSTMETSCDGRKSGSGFRWGAVRAILIFWRSERVDADQGGDDRHAEPEQVSVHGIESSIDRIVQPVEATVQLPYLAPQLTYVSVETRNRRRPSC
ncbi:MAG TPA: hypothetical protein VFK14_06055 [Solirubrobacterales bacterium]|nr:hypothetical protein [Solirubrobacterales bacterium]